jgi:hypothetical protein
MIELVNAAGVVVRTTTTGADGTYTFKDILPIVWTVREVQPCAFRDGTDSPGNMTTLAGNDQFTVDLQPDSHSAGDYFGEKLGSISGSVLLDNDSTSNEKEKGAAAITLRIFDSSGKVVAIVETKPDGSWSADLPVGTYELETVLPEGYRATTSPRVRPTDNDDFLMRNPGLLQKIGERSKCSDCFLAIEKQIVHFDRQKLASAKWMFRSMN